MGVNWLTRGSLCTLLGGRRWVVAFFPAGTSKGSGASGRVWDMAGERIRMAPVNFSYSPPTVDLKWIKSTKRGIGPELASCFMCLRNRDRLQKVVWLHESVEVMNLQHLYYCMGVSCSATYPSRLRANNWPLGCEWFGAA